MVLSFKMEKKTNEYLTINLLLWLLIIELIKKEILVARDEQSWGCGDSLGR